MWLRMDINLHYLVVKENNYGRTMWLGLGEELGLGIGMCIALGCSLGWAWGLDWGKNEHM